MDDYRVNLYKWCIILYLHRKRKIKQNQKVYLVSKIISKNSYDAQIKINENIIILISYTPPPTKLKYASMTGKSIKLKYQVDVDFNSERIYKTVLFQKILVYQLFPITPLEVFQDSTNARLTSTAFVIC